MPLYEMPVLFRIMRKPELVTSLKRTAEAIFEKDGFIRKIDNLGKHATPYKISAHNMTHKEANYFIFYFDVPPAKISKLREEYKRDIDIVRCNIYSDNKLEETEECTLHEELLPPAYRPDVQKMIEIGEREKQRKERFKFKFNTGLDYYPFQR